MPINARLDAESPFHRGEQQVQQRLGVREMMEKFGRRVIRTVFPEQHREFYAQLPFITVGHVDEHGRPWASMLAGRPGFLSTPDERTLSVAGRPVDGDPLASSLAPGLEVGFVGMDPMTRRRNRLTGRVTRTHKGAFFVDLSQSFGNCPQYIQTRAIEFVREPDAAHQPPPVEELDHIDDEARAMIESADTFFVASASSNEQTGRSGGADASHRGGLPGFVRVGDDSMLTIPDYSGNDHYNTLGNFVVNPRAGLLFVDFERGDLLMLTGTIEIIWSGPEVEAFRGAERLWTFCLERGLRLRDRLPVRWSFGEMSPHNAMTGTWSEAEATLQAEAARETWRPYRVGRIVDESDEIRSFYLEPSDGGALPSFRAGQHIPIRVTPPECGKPVIRTYTLSSAPGDMSFRISVKREQKGLVSRYLHDDISVGDVIEVKAPRGGFTFDATDRRPAVLLSGGVGVTPMISMLRYAVAEGFRTRYTRPCTFVHSARTTDARAFYDEARNLEAASGGATRVVSAVGRRIDKEMLSQLLALDDYEFYLCGPGPFMQAMYTALRELGVRDARILAEAFGPSTLSRQPDPDAPRSPELAPAADDAIIQFGRSKFSMPWKPEDGSLLDLAESHGLTPDFSCRRGSCGTCAVRVCSGQVTYNSTPEAEIPQDMALLCQAVPARSDSDEAIVLDL